MSLEVKKINKAYHHPHHEDVLALQNIDFTLPKGESMAITGDSGAGKSTLLNLLAGFDRPDSGEIYWNDKAIHNLDLDEEAKFRQKTLGFVFQFHHLLDDFTVIENVMMPLLIAGHRPKSCLGRTKEILEQVGLSGKDKRLPQELSGGEQQRVALARAVIHGPELILADEPTGNLDERNAEQVFELLCQLNHALGATLIVVTHQRELAQKMNYQLQLCLGRLESFKKTKES